MGTNAALELQFTGANSSKLSNYKHMEKARRMLVDILIYCGFTGHWSATAKRQVAGRDPYRYRTVPLRENEKHLHVVLKPTDNSSRWEYALYPPKLLDLNAVHRKLSQVPSSAKIPKSKESLVAPPRNTAAAPQQAAEAEAVKPLADIPDLAAIQQQANEAATMLGLPTPVYLGLGLFGIATYVQPEAALEWITEYSFEENRHTTKSSLAKYGDDLDTGNWHLHHQGVGFSLDSGRPELIDGKNRLTAAVEENKEIPLLVVLGVPKASLIGIDQNRVRSVRDVGKMVATDIAAGVSFIRYAISGYTLDKVQLSHRRIIEFARTYKDGYDWTIEQFAKYQHTPGLCTSPVKAAVFRAYYHVNRTKLAKFMEVFMTSKYNGPGEFAAVSLQKQLLSRKTASTAADRAAVYGKTTRAIHAFTNDEPVETIRGDKEERYQLPPREPVAVDTPTDAV